MPLGGLPSWLANSACHCNNQKACAHLHLMELAPKLAVGSKGEREWQVMELDDYFSELETISDHCVADHLSAQSYLETLIREKPNTIRELIDCRKKYLASSDYSASSALLVVGLFSEFSDLDRITCITVCFELESSISRKSITRRCEKYNKAQDLFKRIPGLFEHIRTKPNGEKDYELIDYRALSQVNSSEIVHFYGKFAIIDSYIKPSIVCWSKETFPDSPLYIRLNPHLAYDSCPPQLLEEVILMPANPNWWKNLELHNNTRTGASYTLEDCDPSPETLQQFWEYRIERLRRLDVSATRNTNGNLSMMLEELSEPNINDGFIIGKCIHLDTNDPFGTTFSESYLNHLDLAINVYCGGAIKQRFDDNLVRGRVVDASYRTHLLRIENIPFPALLAYVEMFFDTKILVREWFLDQFRPSSSAEIRAK